MSEVLVTPLAAIVDGDHKVFRVGSLEVGLFRQGPKVIGWENRCPHADGPVCQGKIFNRVEENLTTDRKSLGLRFTDVKQIVCPWHGFEFDVTTGKHPADPRYRLRPVDVVVRDQQVYVRTKD